MIGDYNWGLKTKGNVNLMAKIYFACAAIKAKKISKNAEIRTFVYTGNDGTLRQ